MTKTASAAINIRAAITHGSRIDLGTEYIYSIERPTGKNSFETMKAKDLRTIRMYAEKEKLARFSVLTNAPITDILNDGSVEIYQYQTMSPTIEIILRVGTNFFHLIINFSSSGTSAYSYARIITGNTREFPFAKKAVIQRTSVIITHEKRLAIVFWSNIVI
jgi:hypothetical protein